MTTKEKKESEVHGLFEEADLIFSYTREDALADGVLIDVSDMAREAGIRPPVAITAAAFAEYVRVPEGVTGQSELGRLWDILWMTYLAARKGKDESQIPVELLVRNSDEKEAELVTLKALCHPGDSGEPVVTIMLPHED